MPSSPVVLRISRRRGALVQAALVVVIGMSLFDTFTGAEHWPFSPYRMYSGTQRVRTLQTVRAYGVPSDLSAAELPLISSEHIAPFDASRLSTVLSRLRRPERAERLRSALADSLHRYERRRLAGEHAGVPLRGIRVYQVLWTLDAEARNVDQPDRRTLIGEFIAGDEGARRSGP